MDDFSHAQAIQRILARERGISKMDNSSPLLDSGSGTPVSECLSADFDRNTVLTFGDVGMGLGIGEVHASHRNGH